MPGESELQQQLRTQQVLTLSLLFAAGIVNFLDRSSLSIANTTIRSEMHLSATEMGLLLSAFSLAYGFAQLPIGWLLDRAGTRWTLGVGLALWSTAQGLTAFVTTLPLFLALRILLGIGEAPFFPAGIKAIRDTFSVEGRGRATGVLNSSTTLGLALAPPALTWIMLRTGWRSMFLLLGVSGLVVSATWLAFHRPQTIPRTATNTLTLATWSGLFRQRTMWGMMLGFGGINYTTWLYLAWLPGYLENARHVSLAHTGWLAALPFLCGALGMFASGATADRLAHTGTPLTTLHRRIILVGMCVSAACTFFVAHAGSSTSAIAGLCLALFTAHFAGTSAWGYAQAASPAALVASVSSIQNFGSFMIASVAPLLTGWLLDRTHSFNLALTLCAAITLAGALSYATLVRKPITAD
jgi:MFS family permease